MILVFSVKLEASSLYQPTHLLSWRVSWCCCSRWCDCWRPHRNRDHFDPRWPRTAPTVDRSCSKNLLGKPSGAELEGWTERSRTWSDWIQLKRIHSVWEPCCLGRLKERGREHIRALLYDYMCSSLPSWLGLWSSYSQMMVKCNGSLVPLLTGLDTRHLKGQGS